MSERTSFYYDPIRQGYDTNSWRTLSGAPALAGSGRIVVDAGTGIPGSAVHYADILKGDISFNINVPSAPADGDSRLFGVSAPNTDAYIRFSIDNALTCQTSDGDTTTESSAITWDDNWTGANIEFRIRWESGTAKFFVNGTQVYAISDASVPYGTLSLYLFDNSTSAMTVGDINVRGTQSFVMNPKTSDTATTSFSGTLSVSQSVTLTEAVTMLIPSLKLPFVSGALYESVTVTEDIRKNPTGTYPSENLTITESITLSVV